MINKTSLEATPRYHYQSKNMSCPKKAISFISSTYSLLFCFYLPLQLFPCNDLLNLMMAMTGPYYIKRPIHLCHQHITGTGPLIPPCYHQGKSPLSHIYYLLMNRLLVMKTELKQTMTIKLRPESEMKMGNYRVPKVVLFFIPSTC